MYNALKTLHFGTKETVVRINDLSSGLGVQDLEAVVRAGVQVVRLPKTDSAQDVIDCEREIQRIERQAGISVGATGMMAAIESANGVLHAAEIAHASDRLIGIALGAEDYVSDLKTTRSDGIELLFGDPSEEVPGKNIIFPARPELLKARDSDLAHMRRSLIKRQIRGVQTLCDADLDYLAAETNTDRAWVEQAVEDIRRELHEAK